MYKYLFPIFLLFSPLMAHPAIQIYTRIQKAYPDRIQAIFIRDVESGKIELIYPKKGK